MLLVPMLLSSFLLSIMLFKIISFNISKILSIAGKFRFGSLRRSASLYVL